MASTTVTIGAPSSEGTDFLYWQDNIGVLIDPALVENGATAYGRFIYLTGAGGGYQFFRTAATANGDSIIAGPQLTTDLERSDVAFKFAIGNHELTIRGPNHTDNSDGDSSEPYTFAYASGDADIYTRIQNFIEVYRSQTPALKATTTLTLDDGTIVDAEAPTATIASVGTIPEGMDVQIVLTLVDGVYDTRDIVWNVVSGGGSISGSGLEVTYSPADVSADTPVEVEAVVTVRGNGNTANTGTVATVTATVTFTVERVAPEAVAPSANIVPVAAVTEGTTAMLTVVLAGGTYDDSDFSWSIVNGPGSITGSDAAVQYDETYTREDTQVTAQVIVTVTGDGNNARNGSSAEVTATVTFDLLNIPDTPDPAEAPGVVLSGISRLDTGATGTILATVTGGHYDDIDHAWSILIGGGTVSGSGPMIQYTGDSVLSETTVRVQDLITVSGDGTVAADGTSATVTAVLEFLVVIRTDEENRQLAAARHRHLEGDDGLYAIEISHPDVASSVRVVNDTIQHTIEGDDYLPVAFRTQDPQDNEEEVRRSTIRVDNVGDVLTRWIDASRGGAGASLRVMKIVNRAGGDVVYWEVTMSVGLMNYNSREVTITLADEPVIGRPGVMLRHDPVTSPGLF